MIDATPERRPYRHPRLRRAVTLTARVAVIVVVVIASVLACVYLWLTSPPGERWAKAALLRAINGDIRGQVSIERLRVRHLALDLEGIVLRAPSGEVVATIRTLTRIELLPLSLRTVAVYGARAHQAVIDVDLEPGARIPLVLAIASRHPEGAGSRLVVRHVSFERSTMVVRQRIAPAVASRLLLTGLEGTFHAHAAGDRVTATIDLAGRVTTPIDGPVRVAASVERGGGGPVVSADVEAPGLSFTGTGTFGRGANAFAVKRLGLLPPTARAFWPRYPATVPVAVTGDAVAHPGAWDVDGVVSGPGGRLAVRGVVDPQTMTATMISARATNLDVRALLGHGPVTSLTGTMRLTGVQMARPWPTGAVDLNASGALAGQKVERMVLSARSGSSGVEFSRLDVVVPGASLVMSGTLEGGIVNAAGSAAASNLASVASTLGSLTGRHVALSGRGEVHFEVRGPTWNPSVVINGWFPEIESGTTAARGVQANIAVAHLRQPLASSRVRVAASWLAVRGRDVGPLVVRSRALGGHATLDALRAGRLLVHGAASVVPDQYGARIDTLWSRITASWEIVRPATVSFVGGVFTVKGLELRSGPQCVVVTGAVGPERLQTRVVLHDVDLATLTSSVPGVPPLTGRLSGVITASGARTRPALAMRVTATGGPVPGLRDAVTHLTATLVPGGRLAVRAALSSPGAHLSVRGVSTERLLRAPLVAPATATFDVSGTFAAIARIAGIHAPARGRLDARGTLRGTIGSPLITARTSMHVAREHRFPPLSLIGTVRTRENGIATRVRAASLGGTAYVDGTTPWTLARVVAAARGRQLIDAPWNASLVVRRLHGSPIAALFRAVPTLRGTLDLEARAQGPARDPAVDVIADVDRFTFRGSPPLHAHVGITRRPGVWRAGVTIDQRGSPATFAATLWQRGGVAEWPRNFGHLRGTIEAELRCENLDVTAFAPMLPHVRAASGRLAGVLRGVGPLERPTISGGLSWRQGAVATAGFGEYHDVDVTGSVGPDGFSIEHLSLRSGGGRLFASVRGVRDGDGTTVLGSVLLQDFPVVFEWRERARADAHVGIDALVSGGHARGTFVVQDAAVRLPQPLGAQVQDPAPAGDIRVVPAPDPIDRWVALPRPANPAAPAVPRAPENPSVTIDVVTPRPVPVRGPGLQVEALLSNFRIVRDGLWLFFGAVRIPAGDVNMLGTRVALLSQSEIRFAGPPTVPFMAVGARGSFGGESTILVARGAPGQLLVGLAPRNITEAQVFASMSSQGGVAQPLGGPPARPQTASSLPLALVGSRLPLGVLLGLGPAASSFEAGAPVTGRLRLSISDRLGADRLDGESAHTLRLELSLAPSLHAELSLGDAQTGSADVVWVLRRR